jgi:hypothetical protein
MTKSEEWAEKDDGTTFTTGSAAVVPSLLPVPFPTPAMSSLAQAAGLLVQKHGYVVARMGIPLWHTSCVFSP